MDKLARKRLLIRRRIIIRCLTFVLIAAILFWGIRPETFFNRPQVFKDSSWWLDFVGHFFTGFLIAFLTFYALRLMPLGKWSWIALVFLTHTGFMAWFEKGEFGYDKFIQPIFPWLDTAQKGNDDTMIDLLAADLGLFLALSLRWTCSKTYAKFFPNESRAEYLEERSELITHQRAEAKRLEKEYHAELRKELKSSRVAKSLKRKK